MTTKQTLVEIGYPELPPLHEVKFKILDGKVSLELPKDPVTAHGHKLHKDLTSPYSFEDYRFNQAPEYFFAHQTPKELAQMIAYKSTNFENKQLERSEIEAVKNGNLPKNAGPFAFVWDERPGDDNVSDIPSDQFTDYFADYKIGIAKPGHRRNSHDAGHVSSYRRMLSNRTFAEVVHDAATHASGDQSKSSQFTGLIDGLSNCEQRLEEGSGITYDSGESLSEGDINQARRSVNELIDLAKPDIEEIDRYVLFEQLWSQLQFAEYEQEVKDHNRPRKPRASLEELELI